MFNKDNLDTPMNEIYECENTETPREFIRSSEEEFGINQACLGSISEDSLNDYIEFLDMLWYK